MYDMFSTVNRHCELEKKVYDSSTTLNPFDLYI